MIVLGGGLLSSKTIMSRAYEESVQVRGKVGLGGREEIWTKRVGKGGGMERGREGEKEMKETK